MVLTCIFLGGAAGNRTRCKYAGDLQKHEK